MSITIGSDSLYNITAQKNDKTSKLHNALSGDLSKADDKELMDVCKSFESYLLEQVFKKMDSSIPRDEEAGSEYVDYFKDMMIQEYADESTAQQGLGIAQMLYDSMKRNQ